MAKIEAGKYVELVYEIFVVNGEEQTSVFKFTKEHPDAFVFGLDVALLEEFQNQIMGLEQGDHFDFTLEPEKAFGMKNPDLIYELDKEIFQMTKSSWTSTTSSPARPCATAERYNSCATPLPRSSNPATITAADAAVTTAAEATAVTSTATAATVAAAAANRSFRRLIVY